MSEENEKKWREEFEEYYKNFSTHKYPTDQYIDSITQRTWLSYLKACKKQQEEICQLKKDLEDGLCHIENLLSSKDRKCRFDHNNNCQEHGWFGINGICPVDNAFKFLEKHKKEEVV